jgi:hypothetical protein
MGNSDNQKDNLSSRLRAIGSARIAQLVIATPGSSLGGSRLGDCGGGFDWIASLSLAMTIATASI